jgi:proteasome lid subunit RPN8/RPN11
MDRHVLCQIMSTISARRAEAGGILLGPIGSSFVTCFHFDVSASCSGVTYSPDHVTLGRLMQRQWLPAGVDMKGFVHSHPGRFDRLSEGDMIYIRRLLSSNPDMTVFAAPIVIPEEFRIAPIIVTRDDPARECPTTFRLT